MHALEPSAAAGYSRGRRAGTDEGLISWALAAARIRSAVLVTSEDVRAGKPDPEGATVAALKDVPADIQIADLYQLKTLLLQACVTRRT